MRLWRNVFYVAAAWNLLAAAVALLDIDGNATRFYRADPAAVTFLLRANLVIVWLSVLLFGLGYLVVARDPRRNHPIVALAALGKTGVFAVWSVAFARGEISLLGFLGGIGDLAFALVFAWFLLVARRQLPRAEALPGRVDGIAPDSRDGRGR